MTIRELGPHDASDVQALYESLDARDSYLRFFATRPTQLNVVAERATQHDRGHGGVGAFESGALIGAANFVVLDDPSTAELAMVVEHDHQLHGVGSELLARLICLAERHGVRTFIAEVLAVNQTMLRVIAETGLPTTRRREGSAVHIEIRSPESGATT
ncbi:GNAT family N-acetyltransferase [Rhodococcus sp. UNC363MFTsu5.1]|uniref:GNAT family N-acetyltransferase n=1 Tax=Rhodococcus sp. UNC363MFTsu5.1 TaxID=1449069 RepID=UPI00048827DC|nr:GNAT family N-acetyltransferase [Rhodococcus sp. UNC363MFTsu5.1]